MNQYRLSGAIYGETRQRFCYSVLRVKLTAATIHSRMTERLLQDKG